MKRSNSLCEIIATGKTCGFWYQTRANNPEGEYTLLQICAFFVISTLGEILLGDKRFRICRNDFQLNLA
ncbi:MAG: hypothetical protein DRR08_28130 [Candidatus Parabeggiatoa sp. nov. 2]|nr:MAG: hypothetical protein DRR08_28130 [Gammaproteobacteria bacterium]